MNQSSDIKFDHFAGANDSWRAITEDGTVYFLVRSRLPPRRVQNCQGHDVNFILPY